MNSLQELERTTITVQAIYQPKPGKKSGTVKTTDGQLFGAWPKQLGDFEPGETYEIDYTAKQVGNVTYRDVQAIRPAPAARPAQRPAPPSNPPPSNGHHAASPAGNGQQYYRPTAPRDAERMFVCAILGACIKTGRVDLSGESLVGAVNLLRSTWQHTFGLDEDRRGS